jgi:hypothetical protein
MQSTLKMLVWYYGDVARIDSSRFIESAERVINAGEGMLNLRLVSLLQVFEQ